MNLSVDVKRKGINLRYCSTVVMYDRFVSSIVVMGILLLQYCVVLGIVNTVNSVVSYCTVWIPYSTLPYILLYSIENIHFSFRKFL